MATLLEIADVPRTVPVRGKEVEVFGVSARGLAAIMLRFPEIGKLMSGKEPDAGEITNMAPEAIAAFIAAGCGMPGNKDAETLAGNLGVAEQLDLIEEIVRLTFPRGIGPFVEKLEALGLRAQVAAPQPQTSPDQSKS